MAAHARLRRRRGRPLDPEQGHARSRPDHALLDPHPVGALLRDGRLADRAATPTERDRLALLRDRTFLRKRRRLRGVRGTWPRRRPGLATRRRPGRLRDGLALPDRPRSHPAGVPLVPERTGEVASVACCRVGRGHLARVNPRGRPVQSRDDNRDQRSLPWPRIHDREPSGHRVDRGSDRRRARGVCRGPARDRLGLGRGPVPPRSNDARGGAPTAPVAGLHGRGRRVFASAVPTRVRFRRQRGHRVDLLVRDHVAHLPWDPACLGHRDHALPPLRPRYRRQEDGRLRGAPGVRRGRLPGGGGRHRRCGRCPWRQRADPGCRGDRRDRVPAAPSVGPPARGQARLRRAGDALRGARRVLRSDDGRLLDRGCPAEDGADDRGGDRRVRGRGLAAGGIGAAAGRIVARGRRSPFPGSRDRGDPGRGRHLSRHPPRRPVGCAHRVDAAERAADAFAGEAPSRPRGPSRARPAERSAGGGGPRVTPAPGRGAGRTCQGARAEPPRRRPAAAGRACGEAAACPDVGTEGGRPFHGRSPGRPGDRRERRTREPPGPRARDLSAAASRQGTGVGARGPGAPRDDPGRHARRGGRTLPAGGGVGRLLLRPRSTEQRREVCGCEPGADPTVGAGRASHLRSRRRRVRLRRRRDGGTGPGCRAWPTGWRRSAAHSRSSRRRERARA